MSKIRLDIYVTLKRVFLWSILILGVALIIATLIYFSMDVCYAEIDFRSFEDIKGSKDPKDIKARLKLYHYTMGLIKHEYRFTTPMAQAEFDYFMRYIPHVLSEDPIRFEKFRCLYDQVSSPRVRTKNRANNILYHALFELYNLKHYQPSKFDVSIKINWHAVFISILVMIFAALVLWYIRMR